MMETLRQVPFKTNKTFNFTMMASFLPVTVSKKNKQTEKNKPFIAVSHKLTLIQKKHENDFL